MRSLITLLCAGLLTVGGAAQAAPVSTNVILSVSIQGLGPISLTGAGTVSVIGSTLSIGAGVVSLSAPVVVPVTATTAVSSITAMTVSNQAGTFSAGGVTTQAPGEVCGAGPAAGTACNTGGGIGGVMGLSGFINVHVIPNVVVIPVDLNAALLGQGGSTTAPFTIDAAVFTTGVGAVNTGTNVLTTNGSSLGPITLVSPTFVLALGNLLPIFTSLTFTNFHSIPEPNALLLIGAASGTLTLLAYRRRDSRPGAVK